MSQKLKIKIREARETDLEEITNLYLTYVSSFQTSLGKSFNFILFKKLLSKGFGFVAIVKGRVVGFIIGNISKKNIFDIRLIPYLMIYLLKKPFMILEFIKIIFEKEEYNPELFSIAVEKEYQSKGIGRRLVTKLFEEFKKRGIHMVYTKVELLNPANIFYKKLGFKFVKIINRKPKLSMLRIDI